MKHKDTPPWIALGLLLLLVACGPRHETPFDALSEFPGQLEGLDQTDMKSVTVHAEEPIAGGVVVIYSLPGPNANERSLARTFVTQEQRGWQPQASGWLDYDPSEETVLAFSVGGNVTPLTTAYGLAGEGETAQISWSDGVVDTVPIVDGAFVLSRQETLTVEQIQIISRDGTLLNSRDFR
jgi:hypothetical protein